MKRLYIYRILCILFALIGLFGFYKYNTKECIKINNVVNKNYVFLGDSITEFYDLDKYFGKKYQTVDSGINGNRVEDVLENMNERVYRYNPSDVIILIGINNFLYENSSIDYVTNGIKKIVNEIKIYNPNCNIYIQSIYPTNNKWKHNPERNIPDEEELKEKIIKTNKYLKVYCEKNQYTYIDIYNKLKDKNGYFDNKYTDDGLHPNSTGYTKITKILKKRIFD